MKNIMIVGSALMLLSTSAFATKSRLQALGEDKDGSYFISDYRNIYINPAELNSMGNMAVLEWGKSGTAFGSATLDSDSSPKAQGGVLYGLSNGMKVGAILGDETDVASLTRILASNNSTAGSSHLQMLQTADNVVDLFVAGKAAVNWGANFLYTSSKSEATSARYEQSAYAVRLGASEGAWNAHILIPLGAKANAADYAANPVYKGKFGVRIGGGYDLSAENKSFAMYENYTWDQTNTTTATRKGNFSKGILGFGHTQKVSANSTMFVKLQADTTHIQLDAVGSLAVAKIDRLSVPLSIGFEQTATEWLVLRGSVVQNLYGTVKDEGLTANFGTVNPTTLATGAATSGEAIRYLANQKYGASTSGNGGKKTMANSTAVNAGATLKFGSVEVDGNIGATSASRTDTTPSSTVGASTNKGVLALDNLETRVGLTYKF